ncbi:MAG TPA: HAMP domain-containing sensor histidine kinase [Candidatus Binatia bacterium]|nr:HAMP domain-containing sensor histidine kinase [Candidatus Binatia bacterium]
MREKGDREVQTILLLRWVLIVATAYLLLFHHARLQASPAVAVFLAGYLGSNLVVAALLRHRGSQKALEMGIAVFDAAALSVALFLTKDFSADFFFLYFVVIFLAALTERLAFLIVMAVVISLLHLYATIGTLSVMAFLASGALIRIAFLYVVALFFGYLVERVRSAERDAEDARKHEKIITDFVEEVVNSFKTPLGAIQAMAEIALEPQTGSLNLEQAELLRRIDANARHVTRIASNLLDARRVQANRLRVHRDSADLLDVVEEVLSVVRTASDLKGISLELDSAPPLPRVHVDVNQIDRVVWNLLDNAIRCTPAGGEVSVSLRHADREIVLSVSDDGPGIAEADLPAVFDAFRRIRSSRFTSSGFGLFIAKAIVEAHGGTIEVESELGGGTTFTVHLPVGPSAAERPSPSSLESRVG